MASTRTRTPTGAATHATDDGAAPGPGLFTRLGSFLVRRRRWVVVLAAIFMVGAAAYGGDVAARLSNGGFSDPTSESTKAEHYLADTLHTGSPNVVLVVSPARAGQSIDDPAVAAAGNQITAELAATPGTSQVSSYWSLGSPPPLKSTSGDSALVLGHLDGTDDQVRDEIKHVSSSFNRHDEVTVVQVGGIAEAYHQVSDTIEHDLQLAELIALPITLLVLIFVFRSVVSAALPLLAGGFAIVGTFTVLKVLSGFTTVSIFSLNLTTAMGLGLAIDYSLFVVSRYREERARGFDEHEAVVRTVSRAGRSVVFSGLTVAVSLGALLVFPVDFLKSFAYAGIPVVAMAIIGSVIALPAVIAMLGDRINALPVRRKHALPTDDDLERSFWYRVATAVMKRPIVTAVSVTLVLLALAIPFFHMDVGLPDDRVLPTTESSRQVGDELRTEYSSKETGALAVVMPNAAPSAASVDEYAKAMSKVSGVARVDAPTGIYINGAAVLPAGPLTARFLTTGGQWVSVVPNVEPVSAAGEQLVHDVRAVPTPDQTPAYVSGLGAQLVDTKASILARLPWAVGIIVLATFVLLFLSFGSLLVPAKAVVLNTLSLTATFGAMVWIFQDGHLSGPLGFTPTGVLDLTTPILMFCIAFGLSMDYEVFLLSRIKEEHDRTGDNTHSVAVGLARTGRIITAAAATIAVVFLAFATSHVTFIKLFGLGLALAVIVDATVIRATLVPAFMRLAGEANWWAPRWMTRIYERVGMSETEDDPEPFGDGVAHLDATGPDQPTPTDPTDPTDEPSGDPEKVSV